jgi:molecular chaperone DnaK (HSP70)
MAQYNPPPNRLFRNARGLADELEQAIQDAKERKDDKIEVKEARETREALKGAKSSLESVLDGNESLLQEAGYGGLVNRAEDYISRLQGAINEATNFIQNNSGRVSNISAPDPDLPGPIARLSGHSTIGVGGSS